MMPILTLLFLLLFLLYAVSIHKYIISIRHQRPLKKFKQVIHYSITGIYLLIISFITVTWELEYDTIGILWLTSLLKNPLIILLYFSDIHSRIPMKFISWISSIALIVYSGFLYFGLWQLDAPGGNWGNSTQVTGAITTLWSLSNILLATLINSQWNFAGILRLITAMASFTTIILTHTTNHHSGEAEHAYHLLSLFICIYLLYEAFLFFSIPSSLNTTLKNKSKDTNIPSFR